jgi:hypothetical protein
MQWHSWLTDGHGFVLMRSLDFSIDIIFLAEL